MPLDSFLNLDRILSFPSFYFFIFYSLHSVVFVFGFEFPKSCCCSKLSFGCNELFHAMYLDFPVRFLRRNRSEARVVRNRTIRHCKNYERIRFNYILFVYFFSSNCFY